LNPRAALAEAIARRDDIAKRLDAMRRATEAARSAIFDAGARLDAARLAADEAKAAQIERFVTGGGTALATRPVREAREAVTDIEGDVAVAREAVAKLQASSAEQERALDFAERRVEVAIGMVMGGAIGGLLADVEALEAALAAKRGVLFGFIYPCLSTDAADYPKLNAMTRSKRFVAPDGNHPAVAPWRAAYEMLLHDASAALPL